MHVIQVQNQYTAGWAWPATRAVWKWTESPAINVYNNTVCPSGYPCIKITPYYAEDSRYGYSFSWLSATKGAIGGEVYLNTRYASTERQKQAVACHDIGHAIGAGHDWRVSCMGKGDANGPYPYPSSYDYWVVQYKYNYEKRPWQIGVVMINRHQRMREQMKEKVKEPVKNPDENKKGNGKNNG